MSFGVGARLGHYVMVALCSAVVLTAQQPQLVERVDVARILVDARVVDDEGRPILGLEPGDFEVAIDGEEVRVETAQWVGGGVSSDGVLPSTELAGILDPGLRGQLVVFVVQKSLERSRAIGLLRLLQDSDRLLTGLSPEDRVAVLSFDSHLKIWLDFTGNFDEVRTVLAEQVMRGEPTRIEPGRGVSLVSRLSQDVGRKTYLIEDALRLLGNALHAARAAVFCLDITDADYHTLEVGLQTVATETGGVFARTHLFSRRAMDRVANVLGGHYVLFVEKPDGEPGFHRIEVDLRNDDGSVFARNSYVD